MAQWSFGRIRAVAAGLTALLLSSAASADLMMDGTLDAEAEMHAWSVRPLTDAAEARSGSARSLIETTQAAAAVWSIDSAARSGASGGELFRLRGDWDFIVPGSVGGVPRAFGLTADPAPVPLPGTLWLLSVGTAALSSVRLRRACAATAAQPPTIAAGANC